MDFNKYIDTHGRAQNLDGFREEALKEVGLSNHPKAVQLYMKAWSMAGKAQLNEPEEIREVFQHLEDLADIYLDRPQWVKFLRTKVPIFKSLF